MKFILFRSRIGRFTAICPWWLRRKHAIRSRTLSCFKPRR